MSMNKETRIAGGRVDVEPLKLAFEESGFTIVELARALGWFTQQPDYSRVARTLGLSHNISRGRRYYNQTVDPDIALEIAKALNIAPVDIGL